MAVASKTNSRVALMMDRWAALIKVGNIEVAHSKLNFDFLTYKIQLFH